MACSQSGIGGGIGCWDDSEGDGSEWEKSATACVDWEFGSDI